MKIGQLLRYTKPYRCLASNKIVHLLPVVRWSSGYFVTSIDDADTLVALSRFKSHSPFSKETAYVALLDDQITHLRLWSIAYAKLLTVTHRQFTGQFISQ